MNFEIYIIIVQTLYISTLPGICSLLKIRRAGFFFCLTKPFTLDCEYISKAYFKIQ